MKPQMKLKSLLSSCMMALPLLASSAIISPKANAGYPLAKVTNNTGFAASGTVEYEGGNSIFGCRSDNYRVAPGQKWTAKSRGLCLIKKITSKLDNGKQVVTYTASPATSYSNFLIQATGSGYRVFSDSEYKRYSDQGANRGPGFHIVNKTDWPLAISLDQVSCLFHDTVGKGEAFKRDTGAVWFTIDVQIKPDGQTKSDWECITPVAEVVGEVLFAAATGGTGAFASVGKAVARQTVVKRVVKGAIKEAAEPLAEFTAKEIGKLIVDNGKVQLKGQYAGYLWPFKCNTMPSYEVTGGPTLDFVNGQSVIGKGTKLTLRKINDCGSSMMKLSKTSASAQASLDWNQPINHQPPRSRNEREQTPTIDSIVGNYENHLYDGGGKNDWHYVTISKIDRNTLEWKNRAGVSWKLTRTQDEDIFKVGSDSPYFNQGRSFVKIVWDGGRVSGLISHNNELFQKSN